MFRRSSMLCGIYIDIEEEERPTRGRREKKVVYKSTARGKKRERPGRALPSNRVSLSLKRTLRFLVSFFFSLYNYTARETVCGERERTRQSVAGL